MAKDAAHPDPSENRESPFRALCEALPQIVWMADLDSTITYVNQRFTDYTGRPREDAHGWGWTQVVHPDDRQAMVDVWQEALQTGQPYQVEHRLRRADGAYRWFLSRAVPVRDDEGHIMRWFGTGTDIHDQKQAEQQLTDLNETLEERIAERTSEASRLAMALTSAEQRERERIAQVLHDDIQQLLYGLEMSVRQLRRRTDEPTSAQEEVLDQMKEIIDEAIEDARTLSVELSPPVLSGEELGTILEWLAVHMEERYDLSVTLDMQRPCRVARDDLRPLLFRWVRELLFNVVKHAGVDHARVEARKEDGRVRLCVIDEGVGFDVQALGERSDSFGLAHMRERLQPLGGQLKMDSTPDGGTRMTLVVPTSIGENGA